MGPCPRTPWVLAWRPSRECWTPGPLARDCGQQQACHLLLTRPPVLAPWNPEQSVGLSPCHHFHPRPNPIAAALVGFETSRKPGS